MTGWPHLIVAPVVLPLLAGAVLLLVESRRPGWTQPLSLAATLGQALIALLLWQQAGGGQVQAYLLGNWVAPFGIALALDRLAALMLVLTAIIAVAALLHARGRDERRGAHFDALFQFQLMGLNGAFLTADLFNLFVFFEVLLAASYGLLLHGGGARRLRAAVHYVVFNLAASALFLIAASLLYGLAGTLNLADLAQKLPRLAGTPAVLAQAAVLLLVVVFAVKAALLPLYFWLPQTYAAATTPVAALFAILTKVGVYAIVRVTTLLAAGTGWAAMVQGPITVLALLTLLLAAAGALAAQTLRTLIAHLLIASVGTLLLGVGLGTGNALAAAIFYLPHTTLTAAAWFLLGERLRAVRGGRDALQALPLQRHGLRLGWIFFLLAIAAAGLPPLGGFLGKALLLQAASMSPWAGWALAAVLASGLLMVVALARAGVTLFWQAPLAKDSDDGKTEGGARASGPIRPAGQAAATNASDATEAPAAPPRRAGLALLTFGVLAVAAAAGPLDGTTRATANQLMQPADYIRAVLTQPAVPPAHDLRREMRERGNLK
ncbi:MAG: monovalent cation/H+ antiporter subunit D [Pseudomonadota bacterium]